jgi:phosphate-selective porin OprO/OprP
MLLVGAAFTSTLATAATDAAELQALREQVRALEQQLKILARRIELSEETAAAAAPTTAKVTVNDRGYTLASAEAVNSIRFRGLLQADARQFFHDGGGIANNAFVMRRVRIITEGTLAKNFSFQFVPEFGGSSVLIHEANLSVALLPSLQMRFGRFKQPIGLERLQSDSWTFLNERSIATNLTPDRDVGIQAYGEIAGGRVSYALGIFNGLPDAATGANTDFDDDKDIVGRVFAAPFKRAAGSPLHGLSFGVGGSSGRQKTTSGRTAGYRTDGQQLFFAYNPAVVADGRVWRVSPQLDYRFGAFGFLGEYILSTVNVRSSAMGRKMELRNQAWNLAAGYVLTGEDSTYTGVVPRTDFNLAAGTWGAFEVAARYAVVDVDDAAFPTFASPAASASAARSGGLGLNWYLSKAVAFKFDYYHTDFHLNGATPVTPTNTVIRQDEQVFISRFQLAF